MHIWGKVFGFIFGFMVGRIFGAVIGLWLGHMFDKSRAVDFDALYGKGAPIGDVTNPSSFFYSTFSIMGHLAKAKGRVTEQEIAFAGHYMEKLGLDSDMKVHAQNAFRDGKQTTFDLVEQLNDFKRHYSGRRDLLMMFIEIQIQVAFADGELHIKEREVLHTIAQKLGFSTQDLDKLLQMISASAQFHQHGTSRHVSEQQLEQAYIMLGVNPEDDDKTIKKAYKKLMSQHHPDKLVAKGLPTEMMEAAKQKTQDIQAAYDAVMKSR